MSWLLNLFETYQANLDRVGEIERKHNGQEYTLLPISHTTQNAHIEVAITEDGEFHSARLVEKNEASTLIPCTEDSASRAGSKIAPYPLHDKLSYVAGDFVDYGGKIKHEEPFAHYISQLEKWAKSPYAIEKVEIIYEYLKKRRLIKDLVKAGILHVDANNKLIDTWDKHYEKTLGEKPAIFSLAAGGQESAFVRFDVYSPNRITEKVWNDRRMYESFINFYSELLGEKDLCFVKGDLLPATDKHANKIRNAADKAKLISANDTSGFTFRGRFNKASEAGSISYEVSQKAHNALKWLINHQGKTIDQRVFLVWGNEDPDIISTNEDSFSILYNSLSPELKKEVKSYTHERFAHEVAKAIDGYRNELSTTENVSILILDSATTGRMAVLYYRTMEKEQYLIRLKNWHTTCAWLHRYRKTDENESVQFFGAPATKDIAFAAYGPRANEKAVKGLMERMLPCIVDGKQVPLDIERSAFMRANNPVSMEKWEWEKTLSIACALINKRLIHKREGYKVSLDVESTDRDYLFGRLLAIADVLERRALGIDETRSTNAIRYMNSFSKSPARTWKTIQESLQPYQAKLGTKGLYLSRLIDEVASQLTLDDFNNKPLSGKYLLGFYSQRHDLYQKKDKKEAAVEAAN